MKTDLKAFAEECVAVHLAYPAEYGCVGEPESYTAIEFAHWLMAGWLPAEKKASTCQCAPRCRSLERQVTAERPSRNRR